MLQAKWESDIKFFKNYMRDMQRQVSDFRKPFTVFGKFLITDTKEQIQQEKSPDGIPWLPLAPSTILQKRTRLKLRETFKMVKTIFYVASKTELEFGIRDPKYVHHHYGTRKMPVRVVVGVNTKNRRERLNKEILVYLRGIKSKAK